MCLLSPLRGKGGELAKRVATRPTQRVILEVLSNICRTIGSQYVDPMPALLPIGNTSTDIRIYE